MKKILFLTLAAFLTTISVIGQTPPNDSLLLVRQNQEIDDMVVQKNIPTLQNMYGQDFVFSHGSGKIEGKESWLKSVAKGNFAKRRHDSVTVELHKGIAVLRGKLSVEKKNATSRDRYHLKYVRVFAFREERWELISHVTVWEYHEPKI